MKENSIISIHVRRRETALQIHGEGTFVLLVV